MHVVVRQYEGAAALADGMAERTDDIKELLTGVEGFVAYHAARDGDTVTTVSICKDRAGTEETTRRAAAWVQENLPGTTSGPPRIRTGEVFLSF
jgi:hypothetical protein